MFLKFFGQIESFLYHRLCLHTPIPLPPSHIQLYHWHSPLSISMSQFMVIFSLTMSMFFVLSVTLNLNNDFSLFTALSLY